MVDSSLRVGQQLDEVAKQAGRLAVLYAICPRSLTSDDHLSNSSMSSLERILLHCSADTQPHTADLLSVQASQ